MSKVGVPGPTSPAGAGPDETTDACMDSFAASTRLGRGYGATTPVSFPPNAYGLHDMAGNVWDWTANWYADRHPDEVDKPCCIPRNPRGGAVEDSFDKRQPQFRMPRKVIKGGSYLSADSYCMRYRPAARRPQMIDTGMSHIGFRCVVRDSTTIIEPIDEHSWNDCGRRVQSDVGVPVQSLHPPEYRVVRSRAAPYRVDDRERHSQ